MRPLIVKYPYFSKFCNIKFLLLEKFVFSFLLIFFELGLCYAFGIRMNIVTCFFFLWVECLKMKFEVIHKPLGQLRGRGYPKYHFITKALFNKSDHEGGGGSKIPKKLTTWLIWTTLKAKFHELFEITLSINKHCKT